MGLMRRFGGELHQELALATRQTLRGLDIELHEEIARIARAQDRHPLAAQPELSARLGPFGDADLRFGAVEGPDREFSAERGLDHRDRHPAIEIGPVALEDRMRLEQQENVEAPCRPAAHAGLALAAEADARPVLDAGRYVDRQCALARHPA